MLWYFCTTVGDIPGFLWHSYHGICLSHWTFFFSCSDAATGPFFDSDNMVPLMNHPDVRGQFQGFSVEISFLNSDSTHQDDLIVMAYDSCTQLRE